MARATVLSPPLPVFTSSISIIGPGTNLLRIGSIAVAADSTSSVSKVTIGGRILNAGHLVIADCGVIGSGISNTGTLKIYTSTIGGNVKYGASGSYRRGENPNGKPGEGGGIFADGGTVDIFSSLLLSNTAYGGGAACSEVGVPFSECGTAGEGRGGAIFLRSGTVRIFESALLGNGAIGPNGYTAVYPGTGTAPA